MVEEMTSLETHDPNLADLIEISFILIAPVTSSLMFVQSIHRDKFGHVEHIDVTIDESATIVRLPRNQIPLLVPIIFATPDNISDVVGEAIGTMLNAGLNSF